MKRTVVLCIATILAISLLAPALAGPRPGNPRDRLSSGRLARVSDNAVTAGDHRASPALGQGGSHQFGTDVRINPAADNPGRPHNEFAIAGNPLNPQNLIAGSNDYSTNNTSFTGVYYSTDGGNSWSGGNMPCNLPPSGTNCPQGDPGVDFDGFGVAWFVTLCFGGTAGDAGGLCVLHSNDGGATWVDPVLIAQNDDIIFYDRESIVVDKRTSGPHAGRKYVTSTKFNDVDGPIVVIWSDDGINWTETQVSPSTCCYQAANPTVGTHGTLYIGYQDYANYCNDDVHLRIRRSDDGAASFGPENTISGAAVVPSGLIQPGCANTGRQYLLANATRIEFRHRTFPVVAVSNGDDSTVHAVWSDGRWGTPYSWTDPDNGISYSGRHSDVAISSSNDGGATWTPAARVNDDADLSRDQFFPWIAAGPNGLLAVSYLDRRAEYEPGNEFLYNKTVQFGTPNGKLWGPARRVSDASSNPTHRLFGGGTSAFLGDYEQLYADGQSVVATWLDTRAGTFPNQQNQFSDHIQK